MKQTIKTLAIKFGKKVAGAIASAFAMLIGEFVLGLFGKGIARFKAKKLERQNPVTPVDVAEVAPETEPTQGNAEVDTPEEAPKEVTNED